MYNSNGDFYVSFYRFILWNLRVKWNYRNHILFKFWPCAQCWTETSVTVNHYCHRLTKVPITPNHPLILQLFLQTPLPRRNSICWTQWYLPMSMTLKDYFVLGWLTNMVKHCSIHNINQKLARMLPKDF